MALAWVAQGCGVHATAGGAAFDTPSDRGTAIGEHAGRSPVASAVQDGGLSETESMTVQADQVFAVSLHGSIGTRSSKEGDAFRASVLTPLRGPTGRTVVPAGAALMGRVVAVNRGPGASLALKFMTVQTTRGVRPIHATLVRLLPDVSTVIVQADSTEQHDVILHAPPGIPYRGETPTVVPDVAPAAAHGSLRLSARTQMSLVLLAPLQALDGAGMVLPTDGAAPVDGRADGDAEEDS